MISAEYGTNRSRFSRVELERYGGSWVAFSGDGRQIVASGETIQRLEEQLAAAGQDPEQVVFERIPGPEDNISLGGAEFLSRSTARKKSAPSPRRGMLMLSKFLFGRSTPCSPC
jgi:hypothetical protein